MLLVSIARSRKLLLQLGLQDLEAIGSAKSFNRSFAKTPSATSLMAIFPQRFCSVSIARSRKLLLQLFDTMIVGTALLGFNRSFAKTPSATSKK